MLENLNVSCKEAHQQSTFSLTFLLLLILSFDKIHQSHLLFVIRFKFFYNSWPNYPGKLPWQARVWNAKMKIYCRKTFFTDFKQLNGSFWEQEAAFYLAALHSCIFVFLDIDLFLTRWECLLILDVLVHVYCILTVRRECKQWVAEHIFYKCFLRQVNTTVASSWWSNKKLLIDQRQSVIIMPTPEVESQGSFKSVLRDVKRKLSTTATERRNSRQENVKSTGSPFSSLKTTPFSSNQPSPNRSPFATQRKIIELRNSKINK